jgi:hypothetical protein
LDSEDNAMKNVGREFGVMDDDERRRFALAQSQDGDSDKVRELDLFDDPRDPKHMGRHVMPKDPLRVEEERNEIAESGALPEGPSEVRRQKRGRAKRG